MTLFIDGDALPNLLKPIIIRAVVKHSLTTVVIANKRIDLGKSKLISYIQVSENPDEADNRIVELVKEGDLVITADIPLADQVLSKKAFAIDHRGKLFTEENIANYLLIRNMMQEIRDMGEVTKGQAPFGQKDVHKFASQLNQFFMKIKK